MVVVVVVVVEGQSVTDSLSSFTIPQLAERLVVTGLVLCPRGLDTVSTTAFSGHCVLRCKLL